MLSWLPAPAKTWVHLAAAPGTEAVSLAAVNSVGKAGGFLGPLSFGLILHATGGQAVVAARQASIDRPAAWRLQDWQDSLLPIPKGAGGSL